MVSVFSASGQSEISSVCEGRISAFLATRKAPPIGNLQASVLRPAMLGRFRSAAVVRSFVPVFSALPVAGASTFVCCFAGRKAFSRLSGGSPWFPCALLAERSVSSVRGRVTVVGQSLRHQPNKSFNRTAGYGLSRSRNCAPAAAG